jgi:hypothetical protein
MTSSSVISYFLSSAWAKRFFFLLNFRLMNVVYQSIIDTRACVLLCFISNLVIKVANAFDVTADVTGGKPIAA